MIPKIKFGPDSQLKFGGVQIKCFILNNGLQAFDLDSFRTAIGYSSDKNDWLIEFITSVDNKEISALNLMNALREDSHYNSGGTESEDRTFISSDLMLDVCSFMVDVSSREVTNKSFEKYSKEARNILANSKDLKRKINFIAGFDRFKLSHKESLALYMQKSTNDHAFQWVKAFPDEFFEFCFNNFGLQWEDLNQNPHIPAGHLHNIIFARLDHSLLEDLRKMRPRMKYRKEFKTEEYILSPVLEEHLKSVQTLMKASGGNHRIFSQLLDKTVPKVSNASIEWKNEDDSLSSDPFSAISASLHNAFTKR